jgi:hypothetical protein
MIRHDVENLPEPQMLKLLNKASVSLLAAQFFVNLLRIDDIVSMPAARRSLKVWRAIEVSYAECP